MDKKFPPWKLTRAHQSVFLSHIWSKRQLDMVWISETELVKLTLPILQSFWKSLWHLSPLFEQLVKKTFKHGWVAGGGVKVLFSLNHCFLNSKAPLFWGVQDENLKKSRLQDSSCVNFKSVYCEKNCIFYLGLTLPPPHLILLKNAWLVRWGIPNKWWCYKSEISWGHMPP